MTDRIEEGNGKLSSKGSIWVIHKIQVKSNIGPVKNPTEGRLLNEFGGYANITDSVQDLYEMEDVEEVLDLLGIKGNNKIEIRWDIIPGYEGLRLIYFFMEQWSYSIEELDSREITRGAVKTSMLKEQTGFLSGHLEDYYFDYEVDVIGRYILCDEPTPTRDELTVYYRS